MESRRSHILAPLTEVDSGPKGRNILWNDALEISFKELNFVVSTEKLLSYPYWKRHSESTLMLLIKSYALLSVIIIKLLPSSIVDLANHSATT